MSYFLALLSLQFAIFKTVMRDFPAGPVLKILGFLCRDAEAKGSIPGQGTKIPHAGGQLSLCITTTETLP